MKQEIQVFLFPDTQIQNETFLEEVSPSPATHAILTKLKAGECIRHSI